MARRVRKRSDRGAGDAASEPAAPGAPRSAPDRDGVTGKVEAVVETVVDNAVDAVGGAVQAVHAAARRWDERPGARVRRLRRLARTPLPYLYDLHPEGRRADPREAGLRTISPEEIRGTAVGGATQRGADFLPLKPFRGQNWMHRWQRIRNALNRLDMLPPIDVIRYGDGYWVLDGHNRVAAALYNGQVGIDANIIELIPPGGRSTLPAGSLAAALAGTQALRAAGRGGRASPELEEHVHLPNEDADPPPDGPAVDPIEGTES